MRVVVDVNVLISALLSGRGVPARILRAWFEGAFELIVSPLLLSELQRALGYPKLRKRIPEDDAGRFIALLERSAKVVDDPAAPPPLRSSDPGDDYLLALAAAEQAALVSGDRHVIALRRAGRPIYTPSEFVDRLAH
ncbi:MAG: uncharacterized protein QOG63_1786 [Thermoleophilaceae bacterium]|nr:uncharacterized protein [Thermoleophilaceae bacterium]